MSTNINEENVSDPELTYGDAVSHEATGCRVDLQWALESQNLVIRILNLPDRQIDGDEAIRQIPGWIRDVIGCGAVAIRLRENEEFPYFETKGFPDDFAKAENYLCVRTQPGEILSDFSGAPILECMCGNILPGRTDLAAPFFTRAGSFWSCCTTDFLKYAEEKDGLTRAINRLNSAGYESVALIPLRSGDEIVGILELNDSRKDCFSEKMIRFLEGIGATVGILINRIKTEKRLREERARLESQLENRTRELEALNQKLMAEISDRRIAEDSSRESEKRYGSLFVNMLEGLAHCEMVFENGQPVDFIYHDVNEAFARLTGLKDVTGKRVTEVVPGIRETNPELFDLYGRVATTGIPEKIETYVEPLGIWLSLSVYCPEPRHFVAVFENITPRKQAEETVLKNEAFFSAVFEQAGVGVAQVDSSEGKFVRVNRKCCDIVGYTHEEMEQLTFQKITHADDLEAFLANMESLLNGATREFSMEKRYLSKDGSTKWVNLTVSPMWKEDEAPDFHIAVIEDITARKQAEEALRSSENEKSMILESAAEMFIYCDLDLRVRWMNRAAWKTLGSEKESVIGMHCYRIWQRSQQPCQDCPLIRCLETGVPQETEKTTPDGRTWFLRGYPVRDHESRLIGLLEFMQDITAARTAEIALTESERKLKATFDTALVGIDMVDREGRLLEANVALTRILGYTRDELRLKTILDVTHPDDVERSRLMHESMVAGQIEDYRLEKRYVRKDGQVIWADTGVSALRGPHGEYQATIGVILDITQRKKSEEAQGMLAAAVYQSADTVVITDPQGAIVYVNPSFERVTGYSPEEAIGSKPSILSSGHHGQEFYIHLWHTIKSGQTWTGHFVNRRKDGSLFEEDASISPVRNSAGDIMNFVAVKRDVTNEVTLRQQLMQAQKMEAVGTLAGGIAHDFNNILQIIKGYSELMVDDDDLPESIRPDATKISQAAKRGADLVQRLMTFSRKTDFRSQPLDLNRRITDLREMLERTIPKMIDIKLELQKDLRRISADPTQIDQLVMNLAVNARDAMRETGTLTLTTSNAMIDHDRANREPGLCAGPHVVLTISDTGSGMDERTLDHIFEPFFTTKSVGQGTGLGLAMVHGIVMQNGGHIVCDSKPGKGTSFSIYLPALVSKTDEDESVPIPEYLGGTETLLVVDDENGVRELCSRILKHAGYTVIQACDGKEALEIYRERLSEISLVLLDLIMPVMSGHRCLEELLTINPSLKVIVVSGYMGNAPMGKSLEMGAKGLINKPFASVKVLKLVREILDSQM